MDDPATDKQIMAALAYQLDWSTKYLDAALKVDKVLMEQLRRDYNPRRVIEEARQESPSEGREIKFRF